MDDDIPPLRELIKQALDECTDPELLDLVYKLIAHETINGRAD